MWEYVQYLNAELLDLKLWSEGCRKYQIRQTGDDEICLIQRDDKWQNEQSRPHDSFKRPPNAHIRSIKEVIKRQICLNH